MDQVPVIEATITTALKPRGFRKRALNWFRTTDAGLYQIVNLQKSSWGRADCYLNVGWDPRPPANGFQAEQRCALRMRAENLDVVGTIKHAGRDGVIAAEQPGIALLEHEVNEAMPVEEFMSQLEQVVVLPVADRLDELDSVERLASLVMTKPWFATGLIRAELGRLGFHVPASCRRTTSRVG